MAGKAAAEAHRVTVTREGKWWMIRVPDLDILTQSKSLAGVETSAREAIAVTLDVPVEDVELDLVVRTPAVRVTERARAVSDARARAAELEREATADAVALAAELNAEGVPLRDIGEALGVSFQRAQQLVAAGR